MELYLLRPRFLIYLFIYLFIYFFIFSSYFKLFIYLFMIQVIILFASVTVLYYYTTSTHGSLLLLDCK